MGRVRIKEYGSDVKKKYEHKEMHHFSFLINFEMWVDSKPCLNIVFKSSIQDRPEDPQNHPYPNISISCAGNKN